MPRLTTKKLKEKGRVRGSEFAELAGVTRQNINNLRSKGELHQDEDGLYDLSHPANALYLTNPRNRKANSDNQTRRDDPEYAEARGTKDALDREKLQEQINGLRLKNQEKRNELIPRDLVAVAFAKIHAIDSSQFGNLGQNLAPEIMAIGAITDETKEIEIQSAIDRAVWSVLRNAKKLTDNFMKAYADKGGDE